MHTYLIGRPTGADYPITEDGAGAPGEEPGSLTAPGGAAGGGATRVCLGSRIAGPGAGPGAVGGLTVGAGEGGMSERSGQPTERAEAEGEGGGQTETTTTEHCLRPGA